MKHSSRILSTSIAALLTGATLLLGAAALLALLRTSSGGAEITFAPPQNISAETDVLSSGLPVFAYHWGKSDSLNGVSFSSLRTGRLVSPALQFEGLDTVIVDQLDAASGAGYGDLLGSAFSAAAGGPATITLGNLTPSHVYAVQLWANDAQNGAERTLTVSSAQGNSQVVDLSVADYPESRGQYVVGNFIATAKTQAFTMAGSSPSWAVSATQVNGLQLRDVTGVWSGAVNSALDASTPNFSGGQTFPQAVTAAGRVSFEDHDGTGKLVARRYLFIQPGGIATPILEVKTSLSGYTFNAAGGMGITGPATVRIAGDFAGHFPTAMLGAHSYSGPTVLNSGVLEVDILTAAGQASGLGQSTSAASNLVFAGGSIRYLGPNAFTDRNFEVVGTNAVAKFDLYTSGSDLTLRGNAYYAPTAVTTSFVKTGKSILTVSGTIFGKAGAPGVDLLSITGPLKLGGSGVFGNGTAVTLSAFGTLDLNGHDATFKKIEFTQVPTLGSPVIIDHSPLAGTTVLTLSAQDVPLGARIVDGANRKLAVILGGPGPFGFNERNLYSGGLTLVASPLGTNFIASGYTAGTLGNVVWGPYGTGPITIGRDPADRVDFTLQTGMHIGNNLVINSNRGRFVPGLQTNGASIISGAILANATDLLLMGSYSAAFYLKGPISSGSKPTGLTADGPETGSLNVYLGNQTKVPNSYSGNTTVTKNASVYLDVSEQIPHGPGKGDVILNGLFGLSGRSETINGLRGAGTIGNSNEPATLTMGANGDPASYHAFTGTLQSSLRPLTLVKVGAGTQMLGGVTAHLGPTTIQAGTLAINGELKNSPVLVQAGGTLAGTGRVLSPVTLEAGATVQAGVLGDGGLSLATLDFGGDGTIQVGRVANYPTNPALATGALAVGVHRLTVQVESLAGVTPGSTYAILKSATPIVGEMTVDYQLAPLPARGTGHLVVSANEIALKITGTDRIYWTGRGEPSGAWDTTARNWALASSGTPTTYLEAAPDAVLFGDGPGTGSVTVEIKTAPVHPSDVVFASKLDYTVQGAFGIWGSTRVSKAGTGTVTLNTPNGYRGITIIEQGVLRAGHAMALGSASGGTTVASGAALYLRGGVSMAEPLILAGTGISGSGALRSESGDNVISGPVTFVGPEVSMQAEAGTLTAAADLISAGLALTVGGPGNIVVQGSVNLGKGALTKTGPGTVKMAGPSLITGVITITEGTLQLSNRAYGLETPAPVVNHGHLILDFDRPRSESYPKKDYRDAPPKISGTGHVTYRWDSPKELPPGSFDVIESNSYTGGTTIEARVNASASLAFGTGPVEVLLGGALGLVLNFSNDFLLSGKEVEALGEKSAALMLSTANLSGKITLLGDARIYGFGTIAGPISGGYDLEFSGSKTSANALILTGANTYTGKTTITNSSLQLGNGGTTGSLSPTTEIFNHGTLMVNRGDPVELPNVIHGTGILIKRGAETLTLSGASDFTGKATIENGTLVLTGALTGSAVTVANSGTFKGTGTLAKLLSVEAGGTLEPGIAVGEFHADGGVNFKSGSLMRFELNGADPTRGGGLNDLVSITGNLTLDGTLHVAETVPGSFLTAVAGDGWTLFTYTGALIDSGLDLGTMPELAGDLQFALSLATPHEVNLTVIVPEPAAAISLFAGLGILLGRRRLAHHQKAKDQISWS